MKNRSKKYFYIRKLMKFGFDKNVMNEVVLDILGFRGGSAVHTYIDENGKVKLEHIK